MQNPMAPTSVTVPPPSSSAPMAAALHDPFVCSECARRAGEAGDCPCGAGMLFDLRDPAMVDALREDDGRRAERAKQRNIWVGVVTGVVSGAALFAWQPKFLLAIPLPIPFANPVKILALMLALAAGVVFLADRLVPARPRFPYLARGSVAVAPGMKNIRTSTLVAIGLGVAAAVATTVVLVVVLSNTPPNKPLSVSSSPKVDRAAAAPREAGLVATGGSAVATRVARLQGKVALDGGGGGLLYANAGGGWTACEIHPELAVRPVHCAQVRAKLREGSVHLVAGRGSVWVAGVTRMGATPEETEYGVFDVDGLPVASSIDGLSLADAGDMPALDGVWVSVENVEVRQRAGGLYLERANGNSELLFEGSLGEPVVVQAPRAAVVLFRRGADLVGVRVTPDGATAL